MPTFTVARCHASLQLKEHGNEITQSRELRLPHLGNFSLDEWPLPRCSRVSWNIIQHRIKGSMKNPKHLWGFLPTLLSDQKKISIYHSSSKILSETTNLLNPKIHSALICLPCSWASNWIACLFRQLSLKHGWRSCPHLTAALTRDWI